MNSNPFIFLQDKYFASMKIISIFSTFLVSYSLAAQTPVVFVESASHLNIKEKHYGLAKAIVDLNGDFRDDILTVGQDSLLVEVQLNNGSTFKDVYRDIIERNAYTVNVGDFDNDGLNDFLYSGFYNGVSVYKKNSDMFSFEKVQNHDEVLFAQGSSLFDINNDGWLDAVMSHDDGASIILMNDGKGNLAEQEVIDFASVPVSDNSGNYSAIWVDLNQDFRQDLYISKCRAGVDDPTDPRRVNTAFINTDTGFVESAKALQLDLGEQSWCADSGDLDNDGDIDIVVINHLAPHVLMENMGDGTFTKHESFSNKGPISTADLEVAIADFNNDALLDILITGTKDYLLLNQGNLQFKSNDNPFGIKNASSAAVGDLDNDGYLDCYISFGGPDTPSVIADETWINFGGPHNHIKLSLVGTESNYSGIGTQVLLYGPWGLQTRWQNSGVAYGITNSLNIHFGLSDFQIIDSLIINWPGGISEKYTDLTANKHYIATEGVCLEELIDIDYEVLEIDCDHDTITFSANNAQNLIWLDGDTLAEKLITAPGYYQASSSDECRNSSPLFVVTEQQVPVVPEMNYTGLVKICEADEIVLSTNQNAIVLWNNGDVTENNMIAGEGPYFASNFNQCDTISSDTLFVEFLNKEYQDETIYLDSVQDYLLEIPGEMISWYSDSTATQFISDGNELLIENIKADTTVYFQNLASQIVPTFKGGADIGNYPEEFGSNQVNGGLYFIIERPSHLLSFQTIAETEGERRIIVQNDISGDTIYSLDIFLDKGLNNVNTDLILEEGIYYFSTDQMINQQNIGTVSPGLIIADSDIVFPYQIDQFLEIIDSNFGNEHYFYFFNWVIKPYLEPCYSDIIAIEFHVDTTTNTIDFELLENGLSIYPNPAFNKLTIENKTPDTGLFKIYDFQGRQIISRETGPEKTHVLDLFSLDPGIYMLKLVSGKEGYISRFIKM